MRPRRSRLTVFLHVLQREEVDGVEDRTHHGYEAAEDEKGARYPRHNAGKRGSGERKVEG